MTETPTAAPKRPVRQLVAVIWFALVGGLGLSIVHEDPAPFVSLAMTAITLKGGENVAERIRNLSRSGGTH
jgi:hypothetical protein